MTLTVKKTSAMLGDGINVRNEKHGDEDVGACDFRIKGVMLDKDDLNELYGDKYYWDSRYNQKGKLIEPMTRRNEPAVFIGKFESSTITVWIGLGEEKISLTEVKLRKIVLTENSGGLTSMDLQVQAHPDEEDLGRLYTHQGQTVSVNIRFGKEEKPATKAQPELPMDHGAKKGDDDQPTVN